MAERDARVLGKIALFLGVSAGPLLMIVGFVLAIRAAGDSLLGDLCFYGGALGGGLLVLGGVGVLVFVPNRRPDPGSTKS